MANYISNIFGTSPVKPLQDHMDTCFKAARRLRPLFEAAFAGDWDAVGECRERIVAREHEADELKKQIRSQLPKSLFMPVPREDLLELLLVQDRVANLARDISGLVVGRRMQIPESMREDFMAYLDKNIDAARMARKTIRELDELYETGFRGSEAEMVTRLIEELDRLENETDAMQARVRADLFAIENELPPVSVMFLYRVIETIGEIGDSAERLGRRLELLLSH